jgi:ABC-type glycerol-3-phosphate transport system substrate-binding protein
VKKQHPSENARLTAMDARMGRRRFTRGSVGLGLGGLTLGVTQRSALAHQNSTPDASPVSIGEELDLANLSPDIPEPTEPVTVSFASWVGSNDGTLPTLRDQFQELHPNITIEFQDVPAEEATDRLTTRIAGGNPPDVQFLDQSAVIDFASRNALLDLGPYIEKSAAIQIDDYVQAFLDASVYEEKVYGLPIDGETTGLFYRTDMFEAAGITAPPTTWEELEAAAEALTNPDENTYGFILFAPEAAYYWYPFLWQNEGELLSEDGMDILFNSDAGKEAAEFYVGLAQYSPPDYLNSNSYDGRIAFSQGQVGMYVAGAWFAGVMQSEFPDIDGLWSAAPLPERKRCATTVAGDTLVIPRSTRYFPARYPPWWLSISTWSIGSSPRSRSITTQGTPASSTRWIGSVPSSATRPLETRISPSTRFASSTSTYAACFSWDRSELHRMTLYPSLNPASSIIRATSAKNGLELSGTRSPMVWVTLRRKLRASRFGRYPSSRTASRTRASVAGSTTTLWLITRDTVETETLALRAMSAMVGIRLSDDLVVNGDPSCLP